MPRVTAWQVRHNGGDATRAGTLARSDGRDLAAAQARCRDLLVAARSLAAACDHDRSHREVACPLARWDVDGSICDLVQRLAALTTVALGTTDTEAAFGRFTHACAAAVDAVRACRQTAHPTGHCWFSDVPGVDGCAAVLHQAHRFS